ncbi:GATA transcription factor 26 [Dendrobium catenatum]|uniref:GATA transcription factor 26 n=1 Tax=Dendrobium catenatum TaxID=906689 RepID=UPI00109F050A|nr:GATA transcription factor 26 [Dendrobium catenatum]
MGKHGPCRHCGVTNTPLWRNGPPEKPVLCNACGSRWRTKGTLVNYTPLHAREPINWEEPKFAKVKIIYSKPKVEKLQKRKKMIGVVENKYEISLSETLEEDASSGPAISYSESCAHFGNTDANDWTGSAQSNAWDSLVPSKKRSVIRPKHSSVEKLTKDLYSIWHEQQSSNISGTSDDDLLFEDENPIGSVEIGHGGVLLRHPWSKAVEEESEASSLPLYDKLVCDASRPSSLPINIETKRTNFSSASMNKLKISTAHLAQENATRVRFSPDILNMLQSRDSLLWSAKLEGVVSFEVFMKHLTNDEQQYLMKYLPSIDTAEPTDSLKIMFSSYQFLESFSHFKQLLQEGLFDLTFLQMSVEECSTLKRLVLLNLTQSRWVQLYKQLKEKKQKQVTGAKIDERGKDFYDHSNVTPTKRRCESENQHLLESKVTTMRSPKQVHRYISTSPPFRKSRKSREEPTQAIYDAEDIVDNEGTCFSPRSLFTSPPYRSSMLQSTDESSDHDLLINVHVVVVVVYSVEGSK